MKIKNIYHLGIKELWGLVRDPVMIVLIIHAFTLSIYVMATAMPEVLNKAPIAIVDEDNSPASGRISQAFYRPYFNPPSYINQYEMDKRMDQGLDTFALDIPAEFQKDLLRGSVPTIQLNVDATRMSQAFTGSGYIQNIVTNEITEFLSGYRQQNPPPVSLTLRSRFNQELNQSWFGSVLGIINNITMLSIILSGAALIREREHGTIEHLLVMPVSPTEIMLSKVWSMGLVVFCASWFSLIFVVQKILGVQIQGSIGLFMLGTALHLFATTSMGIFLACIGGTMPQFGMLMILILLPLQVLSGGNSPRESMPDFVQNIMLAAPNTHFVMLAQSVLYRGADFKVVWPQLAWLLGIGSVFFAISLQRFRKFLA